MKRSQINAMIAEAKDLFHAQGFRLPPFGYWTPDDWVTRGPEADEIRENALGWDVTDFGVGDFARMGLLLFTVRNGNIQNAQRYPKNYAEKLMVVKEEQLTPRHFHWLKREDIINRGGGRLVLKLHMSNAEETLSDEPFAVSVDGVERQCTPGETVVLSPGESITLEPRLYHSFQGEAGRGTVVVGEVSAVNDDNSDNRFLEPLGRFPAIEEDEPPLHLLCNEYPSA